MTDRYSTCLRITGSNKNQVEQFYNTIQKQVDKGKVEFGVELEVTRITDPEEIEEDA